MLFYYSMKRVVFIIFQAEKKGLVMVNFFSYFLTCSNHSTMNDVIGTYTFNVNGYGICQGRLYPFEQIYLFGKINGDSNFVL